MNEHRVKTEGVYRNVLIAAGINAPDQQTQIDLFLILKEKIDESKESGHCDCYLNSATLPASIEVY